MSKITATDHFRPLRTLCKSPTAHGHFYIYLYVVCVRNGFTQGLNNVGNSLHYAVE